MDRRKNLEAALARAERELQAAVARHASSGADRFNAGEAVDKARAACRSARAALMELENAELAGR